MRPMRVRQRPEKNIHRDAPPRFAVEIGEPEMAVGHHQLFARRYHIHVIAHHPLTVGRLHDTHLRPALNHLREDARVIGREMQDHHERDAGVRRHSLKELLQGGNRARGPAQRDHRIERVAVGRDDVVDQFAQPLFSIVRGDRRQAGRTPIVGVGV